jgi:hypothetical protein
MLNVFDLHLSTPEEKAVSRICAFKTRRNLQTFGRCFQFKQSYPWASLILLLYAKNKQRNQCNGASRLKEKLVLRIRDVCPGSWIQDPGSDFFPSQIPDPRSELSPSQIPDPGSASKNLSILTHKNGF